MILYNIIATHYTNHASYITGALTKRYSSLKENSHDLGGSA
jgi:hypothetical protein